VIKLLLEHNVAAQKHWLNFLLCHSCFVILGKLLQISGYLYLIFIPFWFCLLKLFIGVKTFSLAFCVFYFEL